jgi:hypothetical protein
MMKRTASVMTKDQFNDLMSNAHAEIDRNVVVALSIKDIVSSLKGNQSIQSLHLKESLFACAGYRSPTLRHLRCLLECIPHLTRLEEVTISGEMSIENPHDVQILSNAIHRHPTLRRIKLHNFVVYAPELPNSTPLLDVFLRSCSTLPHLETLHIQCHASYKTWQQCYISVHALEPVCRSPLLQKLTLSKLGLQDEHYSCIGHTLEKNGGNILSQLILSDNGNSDIGTQCIVTQLLHSRFHSMERLEIVNRFRASEVTSNLVLDLLNTNYSLKHCKMNLKHQYRGRFEFYLVLNRAGRKVIMNPDALPNEVINILGNGNSNISVLMQLLLDNPTICRPPNEDFDDDSSGGEKKEMRETITKSLRPHEPPSMITDKECNRHFETDDVGTISVTPVVMGVVHNLATDLWRILWPARNQ